MSIQVESNLYLILQCLLGISYFYICNYNLELDLKNAIYKNKD